MSENYFQQLREQADRLFQEKKDAAAKQALPEWRKQAQAAVQDMVNHPAHYKVGGIETIDFMKAKLSPEGWEGYLAGNVIKYISRYPHKHGVEDLEKAMVYLAKLITAVKEKHHD